MPWEAEDYLVDEYEQLIKANHKPSVPMHFADVVIAIALQQSVLVYPAGASGGEGWWHIREHLRKALRVLDALPIIATDELKRNKKFIIPGIVQLKVKDQRPKKAAKPTVKAFPSKSIRRAGGGVTPVERCCPWCVWCPWQCEAKRLDEEEEDDAM